MPPLDDTGDLPPLPPGTTALPPLPAGATALPPDTQPAAMPPLPPGATALAPQYTKDQPFVVDPKSVTADQFDAFKQANPGAWFKTPTGELRQVAPPPAQAQDTTGQKYDYTGTEPAIKDTGLIGALGAGLVAGGRGVVATPQALAGGRPTGEEPSIAAAQPAQLSDFLHPWLLAEKTVYQFARSAPTIAAAALGSAMAGGPETPAGWVGAGAGAAVGSIIQDLGNNFGQALKETNNDPEAAWALAMKRSAIGAAGSAAGFGLFGLAPFQGAVKNIVFQAFGIQPAVAVGEQAAQNITEGRPVTEGMGAAAVGAAVGTVAPAAAHAGARYIAGRMAAPQAAPPLGGGGPGAPPTEGAPTPGATFNIDLGTGQPEPATVSGVAGDIVILTDANGVSHRMTTADLAARGQPGAAPPPTPGEPPAAAEAPAAEGAAQPAAPPEARAPLALPAPDVIYGPGTGWTSTGEGMIPGTPGFIMRPEGVAAPQPSPEQTAADLRQQVAAGAPPVGDPIAKALRRDMDEIERGRAAAPAAPEAPPAPAVAPPVREEPPAATSVPPAPEAAPAPPQAPAEPVAEPSAVPELGEVPAEPPGARAEPPGLPEARAARPAEAAAPPAAPAEHPNAPVVSAETHTKTREPLFAVRFPQKPDIADLGAQARRFGGRWSSYRGQGMQPGWMFKTREGAEQFAEWARGQLGAAVQPPGRPGEAAPGVPAEIARKVEAEARARPGGFNAISVSARHNINAETARRVVEYVRQRLGSEAPQAVTEQPAAIRSPVDDWADEIQQAYRTGGARAAVDALYGRGRPTGAVMAVLNDKIRGLLNFDEIEDIRAEMQRQDEAAENAEFATPSMSAAAPTPLPPGATPPPPERAMRGTEIGKNYLGQTLYEDARGARSIVENGIRKTEPVEMVPTRGGTQVRVRQPADKEPEYQIAEPHPTTPNRPVEYQPPPTAEAETPSRWSPPPGMDPDLWRLRVDVARARDETEAPSEGQKGAGNYAKGKLDFHGLPFVMETPEGEVRRGIDARTGEPWEVEMPTDYGYLSKTEGADGEHIDAYLGPDLTSHVAYVVDQTDADTGRFDEHKILLGFDSWQKARDAYLNAFSDGRGGERLGNVTEMPLDELKQWLKTADLKNPVGQGSLALEHQAAANGAPEGNPQIRLASWVQRQIAGRAEPNAARLVSAAEEAYGSKLAEGKFTRADIYDAVELGMNRYISAHPEWFDPTKPLDRAKTTASELAILKDRLPTQTVRAGEKDTLQQYSTPPDYAYAAAWAANLGRGDRVLEPSAGTGSLVAPAMNARPAEIVTNELSAKRAALLGALEPKADRTFRENAEQLHNILPADVKPTVVLMNPPFSSAGERMAGKRMLGIGARHVEQALARLEPGGRLVAIVGRGMRMDVGPGGFREGTGAAFRQWWDRIGSQYDVRANVGVPGNVYTKYGTSFGTRLLIIDKNPPSGRPPVIADATDIPDLMTRLDEVRNDRQPPAVPGEPVAPQPSGGPAPPGGRGEPGPGATPSGGAAGPRVSEGPTDTGAGGELPGRTGVGGEPAIRPEPAAGAGHAVAPEQPAGGEPVGTERRPATGTGAGTQLAGSGAEPDAMVLRPEGGAGPVLPPGTTRSGIESGPVPEVIRVDEAAADPETAHGITESVYEPYKPQRITIKGAVEHPTRLVQSAAMASVMPPDVKYTPNLPRELITGGKLSDAQLEGITYAGHAHSQTLPPQIGHNGGPPITYRRGFFIGDGTGTGKGRQVAGIMFDNWRQGRQKALWISESRTLIHDARRDWGDLTGNAKAIFDLGKAAKPGAGIKGDSGIGFLTYDTLKGYERQGKDEAGKTIRGQSRVDQIVDWLGKDFDGVIAFDESHNMANSIQVKGTRGIKDAAQKALAGIELQQKLPNARVVYVSATGATEVMNLAYAERLGLWGEGTAFPSKTDFISKIASGGVAAMELVARDMKALGHYISRNLSFGDESMPPEQRVEYDRIEHTLTPDQHRIYDDLAEGWQHVLNNIEEALELTGPPDDMGAPKADSRQRANALSAFWSAHQRFFNQIITSMQMPTVLKAIERDLAEGRQAVLQLVNTNEASQERAINRARAEEGDLEDLDMTPRDQLLQMVDKSFPTAQMEEYVDENNNTRTREVRDSAGNIVHNPEALARKDALLAQLGSLRVPDGPLEMLLNHFGPEEVAEITGRKQRVVRKPDENGVVRAQLESRPGSANVTEADAFQNAKKRILVFSQAGMTGRSYHADLSSPSAGARRSHYLVQAGWRADKAIQGFGRTHRTNQGSAPIFHLVTTDLRGQKRFISSIARRLAQLGALTKGERRAGESGLFSARDNLESNEATSAMTALWRDLQNNRVQGVMPRDFERQTGLRLENSNGEATSPPQMSQFLNRLLSLKFDMQNHVFAEFEDRLNTAIDRAASMGLLDVGTETLKADRITKTDDRVVHTDPASGAETRYVKLEVANRTKPEPFRNIVTGRSRLTRGEMPDFFVQSVRSGKVLAVTPSKDITDADGRIIPQVRLADPLGYDFNDRAKIMGPGSDRYWRRIDDTNEASRLWDEQVAKIPEFVTRDEHLITGAILPIWDRLGAWPKVYRLQTDAGEKLLGRTVADEQIDGVLKALGAETTGRQYTPQQIADEVMAGGRATLANGWSIRRSTVANQPRIELVGPDYSHNQQLANAGVFTERIGYSTRYFIPTGDAAAPAIERITQRNPVSEMVRGAPETGGGLRDILGRLMSNEEGAWWPFGRDIADEAFEAPAERAADMIGPPPAKPPPPPMTRRVLDLFGAGPRAEGDPRFMNPAQRLATAPSNAARNDLGGVSREKWAAESAKNDRAAQLRSRYVADLKPFLDLSKEDQQKVIAAAELARLQERRIPLDGRQIILENAARDSATEPLAHQPLAQNSRPGDLIHLSTPEQIAGFAAMKKALDHAYDDYVSATAKAHGWQGEPTYKAISEAAERERNAGNPAAAKRLDRVAKIVGVAEFSRRAGYVPFTRQGDYFFRVTPKAGTPDKPGVRGWDGDGFPPTVWYSRMDSRLPEEVLKGGARPGGARMVNEYRDRLRQTFPESQYDVDEGFYHAEEGRLRQLDIPAIEELLQIMGRDLRREWRGRIADATDPDAEKAAYAKAKALHDNMVDTLLDQVYEKMRAGFRKQSLNIPGYEPDLLQATGLYVNWLSEHNADLEHRERIAAADQAVERSPDPVARRFWQDWNRAMDRFVDPFDLGLSKLRQAAFYYTLGMNLNSTLKVMLHGPMLGSWVLSTGLGGTGRARALAAYGKALTDVSRTLRAGRDGLTVDPMAAARTPAERAFIKHNEETGRAHPTGAEELMAARRQGVESATAQQRFNRRVMQAWASNITAADRVVRGAMLLASYRLAQDPAMMDRFNRTWGRDKLWAGERNKTPEKFAEFMLDRTAGIWGFANRPQIARSALGAMLYQFRSYELNYLSNLHQQLWHMGPEGKVTAILMLGTLGMAAGAVGLPFAKDLEGAYEATAKMITGIDPNIEERFLQFMKEDPLGWGADAGKMALYGVEPLGIDIGPGLSFGDLISRERSWLDYFGPAVSIFGGGAERAFQRRDQSTAAWVAEMMPTAVKNLVRAFGVYPEEGIRSVSGRVLVPRERIGVAEQYEMAAGLRPSPVGDMSREQERAYRISTAQRQSERAYNQRLGNLAVGRYLAEQRGDAAAAQGYADEYQQLIARPPAGVKPSMEAIRRAMAQAISPEAARLRAAPRAVRGQIAQPIFGQPQP